MENIMRQSRFSRTLANDAKMGAYYTDTEHCRRIGQLFEFPDDEEVACLEPSIGDASAVKAVTENCRNCTVFGVELNGNTYNELQERGDVPYLLNADFLSGVKISHSSFSFCFANPPYGMHQDSKERLEKLFVEKLWGYLKTGGVLALVIPHYVLTDEKFIKSYIARFNPVACFRFDDDVYASFKQIVVIGKKRHGVGFMPQWLSRFWEQVDQVEKLAYLPEMGAAVTHKIPVKPSSSDSIEYFTTLKFDDKKAAENLVGDELYELIGKKAFMPEYHAAKLSRPPVPLKKDSLYLCAIAGYGQGLAGSASDHDLHLQRGVAKVVTTPELEMKDGQTLVVEHSYTKMVLNIIENDGRVTTLE